MDTNQIKIKKTIIRFLMSLNIDSAYLSTAYLDW